VKSKKPKKDWAAQLQQWAAPFLRALAHPAQRRWAPVYLTGLLGPGERKSAMALAEQVAPEDGWQVHHFVSGSPWPTEQLEGVLAQKAQELVGGAGSHLIVDDTALVKQGRCSVGVAPQYCGELGKKANCQCLVSLTLARNEVPVPVALRLYLPEAWCQDPVRRQKCGVPDRVAYRPKWQMAIEEIDRLKAAGVRFGDVLADVGYGAGADFRHALEQRHLRYAVGILPTQKVYPAGVRLEPPRAGANGRPRKHPQPTADSVSAEQRIQAVGPRRWRQLSWRVGSQGKLQAEFLALRVRLADGPEVAQGRHLPSPKRYWLVAERRKNGEIRYYVSNLPSRATLLRLARQIKGRWVCEQAHEQLKQELGLDHFEGRSWTGLHHHLVLTLIAFAFLQHSRLAGKKSRSGMGLRLSPARLTQLGQEIVVSH
jgi:SRSO17 transposase